MTDGYERKHSGLWSGVSPPRYVQGTGLKCAVILHASVGVHSVLSNELQHRSKVYMYIVSTSKYVMMASHFLWS